MKKRNLIPRGRTVPPLTNQKAQAGFTLIELLVVIAIIAILAAMILPALGKAKAKAQGITCMSNGKQLSLAFNMYTMDFTELYPPNPDDSTTTDGYNWCAGSVEGGMPNDPPPAGAHTFDPDILKDPNKTLVAPYIAGNVGIFSCPADPRSGRYNGTDPAKNGLTMRAARSVAMNQAVGTIDPGFAGGGGHSGKPTLPTTGPWLTGNHGENKHDAPWATFGKTTDFRRVSSAQIFLMVDEHPYSINDGALAVSAGQSKYVDFPTTYHNNGCGFSFCDGHAEVRKWKGGALVLKSPATGQVTINANMVADMIDWTWLRDHTTFRMN